MVILVGGRVEKVKKEEFPQPEGFGKGRELHRKEGQGVDESYGSAFVVIG